MATQKPIAGTGRATGPGSLRTHEQGLIITTSDFSAGAREEAARRNAVLVALMNGEQVVALPAQYEIGVTRQTYGILEMDEQTPDAEPSRTQQQ
ncbi:MAG: restriction endonuclease [Thermogutta sp.]